MRRLLRDGMTWAVILTATSIVGCGPKGPAVEMVEGKILLDGEPLAEALVGFSPAGGGGLPAAGLTGADGSFRLNAVKGAKPGAGTAVGEYVVTVAKRVTEGPAGPSGTDDPNYGKSAGVLVEPKVKNLVPDVYGDPKTSPLKASVVAGKNAFEFKLDSKAKKGK
jgi:hypothetical protein